MVARFQCTRYLRQHIGCSPKACINIQKVILNIHRQVRANIVQTQEGQAQHDKERLSPPAQLHEAHGKEGQRDKQYYSPAEAFFKH
jgi:hypothetical protein